MRKTLWLVPVTFCLSFSIGQGAIASSETQSFIEKSKARWLKTYEFLHQHPELSTREEKTAAYLAKQLKALGFSVREGIGGQGLVGKLTNGPGPTVMVRTDMDALPVTENTSLAYRSRIVAEYHGKSTGVMHACGHDMHMAVWLGTAETLARHRKSWSGTVLFLAQPAEEIGLGARAMIDDGLFTHFKKPDYAIALHVNATLPAGQVGLKSGYALANADTVTVKVQGKGGHGAFPHQTKDPMLLAAKLVIDLQTLISREVSATDPAIISVGKIEGGTKANIIPDSVTLELTVRTFSPETRKFVLDGIRRHANGLAMAAGLPPQLYPIVTVGEGATPSTYNTPLVAQRAVRVWKEQGFKVIETEPVLGAEDFSRYGREGIPALIFWLGAVDPKNWEKRKSVSLPSLHSAEFAPLPVPTLTTGVSAMTALALELFQPAQTAE